MSALRNGLYAALTIPSMTRKASHVLFPQENDKLEASERQEHRSWDELIIYRQTKF